MDKQQNEPGISANQLQEILKTVIAEVRKPTELEQKKLDKEHSQEQKMLKQRVMLQTAEAKARESRRANCAHGTVHPGNNSFKHSWAGQIHSPAGEHPYIIPTCQQCQTQTSKIYVNPATIIDGAGLDRYPSLTVDSLEAWAKGSREKYLVVAV